MLRPALNVLLVYGLVGLVVAGGVVTFSELTSKVVPVFPRNGQIALDFTMTSTLENSGPPSNVSPETFTLNLTTNSIMVHRSGEFNVTSEWSSILNTTKTVTLQDGKKVSLGGLTLPEGNITMVRIGVVNAVLQRTPGGSGESVEVPSDRLLIPSNAQVRAQSITHILVDLHLVCPGSTGSSPSKECIITPVLHVED